MTKQEKELNIQSAPISISGSGHIEAKGMAKWSKPKLAGKKKSAFEYLRGHEKHKSSDTWVFKTRKIDRENDKYFEEVLDDATGETIRFCVEPLSKHIRHGSAKFENEE